MSAQWAYKSPNGFHSIYIIGSKLSINIMAKSLLVGHIRYLVLNPGVSTMGMSPLKMGFIQYMQVRNLVSILWA